MNSNEISQAQNADTLTENDKNKHNLICERCSSLVLLSQKADLVKKEFYLPHMKKKTEGNSEDGETLTDFWVVDDMFTFENVGFSNTLDGIKYLICADCEVGPIGWHDIADKKAFYISTSRIKYSETE